MMPRGEHRNCLRRNARRAERDREAHARKVQFLQEYLILCKKHRCCLPGGVLGGDEVRAVGVGPSAAWPHMSAKDMRDHFKELARNLLWHEARLGKD